MNQRPTLPVVGRLVLEDDVIVARRDDTNEPCGFIYVGPDGIELEGEFSVVQVDDPSKVRFKLVRKNKAETRYIGGFSANIARPDGRGDEIGYTLFSLAEDAEPWSLRSQFSVYLKRVTWEQPSPALVLTSAYSRELFNGARRIYGVVARSLSTLWKFETPEDRNTGEDEPVTPPEPPADDWLSPESQAKRAAEIARIRAEFPSLDLDEDRVRKYMSGGNRNLAEVHDDERLRADPKDEHGQSIDPCHGVNRVPL